MKILSFTLKKMYMYICYLKNSGMLDYSADFNNA